MTAHDVVAVVRKRLGERRVGHAGTLDPLAAGVLPIAVGAYTRLLPYLEGGKTYLAAIGFGKSTTTCDLAGEVLEERHVTLERADVDGVLGQFRGLITQRPPAYSAIHVNGKRAYDLARAGIAVEVPVREISINRLILREFFARSGSAEALVEVDCSAGTYVRSLAVDLGVALGVPAHLAFLLRTRAGAMRSEQAARLDHPWPWISSGGALAHLPSREVDEGEAGRLRNGRPIASAEFVPGPIRLEVARRLLAVGEIRDGELWPKLVLPAGDSAGE